MKSWLSAVNQVRAIERFIWDALKSSEFASMTMLELASLNALFTEDGVKPTILAARINVPSTSFTPILDRLEEGGFIKREKHPTDRRAITIHLTDKGRQSREMVQTAFDAADVEFSHLLDLVQA